MNLQTVSRPNHKLLDNTETTTTGSGMNVVDIVDGRQGSLKKKRGGIEVIDDAGDSEDLMRK